MIFVFQNKNINIQGWNGQVVQNWEGTFVLADVPCPLEEYGFPPDDLIISPTPLSEGAVCLDDLSPLTSLNSSRCCSPGPSTSCTNLSTQPDVTIPEAITQQICNKLKHKNARNKTQSKANKKRKKTAAQELEFVIPAANTASCSKYRQSARPVHTSNKAEDGHITKHAYTALPPPYESDASCTLENLIGENSIHEFRLVAWDGRTAMPLVDAQGAMYGLLAGRPDDPSWQETSNEAARLMEDARRRSKFSVDNHQRPRGPFPILRCGVSHGGGQTRPCNVSHADTKRNRKLLYSMNRAPCFRWISNFASSVFASWAPNLYEHYADMAKALHGKYPDLECPFPQSVFSATTYNLSPQTVCIPHTDLANLPYGWCAIFVLGSYDPTKGGHLVLWECKLVVEFPPGSLVFIPSAIITHSNTTIQPHEKRYSFTQYTAGALFRWVDQGFQSQVRFQAEKNKEELGELDKKLKERWKKGLALLPSLQTASLSIPANTF